MSDLTPPGIRAELEKDADDTVADDARRYGRARPAEAPPVPARAGRGRLPVGKRFPGRTTR